MGTNVVYGCVLLVGYGRGGVTPEEDTRHSTVLNAVLTLHFPRNHCIKMGMGTKSTRPSPDPMPSGREWGN